MKSFICVVCPKGCRLSVDAETAEVTGNSCEKGYIYAENEIRNPVRVLTGTVNITGALYPRLPVKTDRAVPKGMLSECMRIIRNTNVNAPVEINEILIRNIAGTEADLVAAKKGTLIETHVE